MTSPQSTLWKLWVFEQDFESTAGNRADNSNRWPSSRQLPRGIEREAD